VDYFDYESSFTDDFDIERFLQESQKQERERISEDLERIEEQLSSRKAIHQTALDELESKLDWYLDRLEKAEKRSFGETEEEKRLKKQIKEFYREIRNEKRQYWSDCQKLEQERRERLQELKETDPGLLNDIF
jgi:chromosome segregation ATPase